MAVPVRCINEASNVTLAAVFPGIASAIVSLSLAEISPLQGGVFGAVTALVALATKPIFMKIFAQRGANDASHVLGFVLHIVVELGVSLAVWGLLGLQISLIPIPLLIVSQVASYVMMVFFFDANVF